MASNEETKSCIKKINKEKNGCGDDDFEVWHRTKKPKVVYKQKKKKKEKNGCGEENFELWH